MKKSELLRKINSKGKDWKEAIEKVKSFDLQEVHDYIHYTVRGYSYFYKKGNNDIANLFYEVIPYLHSLHNCSDLIFSYKNKYLFNDRNIR